MTNEIILIVTLICEYSLMILMFFLFGKQGLYLWTIMATITANIEVLILVDAFGIEMTLGNILFATTFLVTDILSELYGKKDAQRAVLFGMATSIIFILISASWMLYEPSKNDFASPSIRAIFSNTPRLMIASIAVYIIVQFCDVWLYHKWWDFSSKLCGDKKRFLWLRNNGSTLISQLLNTVLYNAFAFAGVYSTKTLVMIMISSYMIFFVTSLADTPFLYLARKLYTEKKCLGE